MIYLKPPKDFQTQFEVVACFCEFDDHFILLKRQDHKDEGNKWGIPAGKPEAGENYLQAIQRELHEETGIELGLKEFQPFHTFFVRYPDYGYDFIFQTYSASLPEKSKIVIRPDEHKEAIWTKPQHSLKLDLVKDLDACIKLFYRLP